MNRKPTRKTRQRRRRAPDWATLYRERGEVPEYGTEAYGDLMAWVYMHESIPGLPAPESPEALELQRAARPAMDRELARVRRQGIDLTGLAPARTSSPEAVPAKSP